jgi:hypothetical protein
MLEETRPQDVPRPPKRQKAPLTLDFEAFIASPMKAAKVTCPTKTHQQTLDWLGALKRSYHRKNPNNQKIEVIAGTDGYIYLVKETT